jgi:hypothetical protein
MAVDLETFVRVARYPPSFTNLTIPSVVRALQPQTVPEALPAVLSRLLKAIVEQTGITVVIASHDPNVRAVADWVYELRDGRLVGWRRQ